MFIKLLLLYLYIHIYIVLLLPLLILSRSPIGRALCEGGVEARAGEDGFFRFYLLPMQNVFRWSGRFVRLLQELLTEPLREPSRTALGLVGLEKVS